MKSRGRIIQKGCRRKVTQWSACLHAFWKGGSRVRMKEREAFRQSVDSALDFNRSFGKSTGIDHGTLYSGGTPNGGTHPLPDFRNGTLPKNSSILLWTRITPYRRLRTHRSGTGTHCFEENHQQSGYRGQGDSRNPVENQKPDEKGLEVSR